MTKRSSVLSIVYLFVTMIGLATFVVTMNASYHLLTVPAQTEVALPASPVAHSEGMFNPGARLDTSQIDDLRTLPTDPADDTDADAEGRDVLTLDYGPAPADLWNALRDHPRWYDDQGAEGYGQFVVPVGTVIDVPGGLYLATLDGWFTCTDFATFDGECSAAGPVVPVELAV